MSDRVMLILVGMVVAVTAAGFFNLLGDDALHALNLCFVVGLALDNSGLRRQLKQLRGSAAN
jgi:hypothetical protein